MLLNYLKLAIRLLIRNPFFTFVNVLGLSVGFAVFFVLWQYSQNELKSDQFHKDYEQIYKVCVVASWTDDAKTWQENTFGFSQYGMAQIVGKYSGMIDRTRYFAQPHFSKNYGLDHGAEIFMSCVDELQIRKSFLETKVIYAEPNFFSFFSLPFVDGDPKKALKFPDAVVISEKTARKYFGSDNPIGKTLMLNNTIHLQVTGVFKNLPQHTHLDFDIAISAERIRKALDQLKGGEWFFAFTYCKFQPGINIETLQSRINLLSAAEINNQAWGNWRYGKARILLQPLKEVAFQTYRFDIHKPKSKYLLFLYGTSSLIILMMAWINYINLTVASNNKRMKEVAARKTVGARAIDFITQFVVEASLVNLASFLLALTFVQLFKTPAGIYLQFHIPSWSMIPLSTWIVISSTLLIGILLTGLYPALITAKRSPKTIFHSSQTKANGNIISWILTTAQFSAAMVLIVWIFALHNQLTFISNRNIGLNQHQVLIIDLPPVPTSNFYTDIDQLAQQASALPEVSGHTVSNNVSADAVDGMLGMAIEEGKSGIQVDCNGGVDENFIPFYSIKLLAGRNFQADRPSDRSSILISRGAMYRLGIERPEDAVGLRLHWPVSEIIGVFEDYTLRPLIKGEDFRYGGIPGLALTYKDFLAPDKQPRKISFRVEPANFDQTIENLKIIYHSIFPGNVFNWYFLHEHINNQYQSDRTARNQILFFSTLAVGIACLGLFGMISNKVVEKTKEIGIRKVLGAELYQIAQILANTTIKQAILSTVVGIPVAFYLTEQYLDKFIERVSLQWWHFTVPVLLLVAIMFATIASILWKAATKNPVEALKYE